MKRWILILCFSLVCFTMASFQKQSDTLVFSKNDIQQGNKGLYFYAIRFNPDTTYHAMGNLSSSINLVGIFKGVNLDKTRINVGPLLSFNDSTSVKLFVPTLFDLGKEPLRAMRNDPAVSNNKSSKFYLDLDAALESSQSLVLTFEEFSKLEEFFKEIPILIEIVTRYIKGTNAQSIESTTQTDQTALVNRLMTQIDFLQKEASERNKEIYAFIRQLIAKSPAATSSRESTQNYYVTTPQPKEDTQPQPASKEQIIVNNNLPEVYGLTFWIIIIVFGLLILILALVFCKCCCRCSGNHKILKSEKKPEDEKLIKSLIEQIQNHYFGNFEYRFKGDKNSNPFDLEKLINTGQLSIELKDQSSILFNRKNL